MKLTNIWPVTAAFMFMLALQPQSGWATKAVGAVVTGEITAAPSSEVIEVAHHAYHIQANSSAARAAHGFYLGQVVDLILDPPAANSEPEVVSIAPHSGS